MSSAEEKIISWPWVADEGADKQRFKQNMVLHPPLSRSWKQILQERRRQEKEKMTVPEEESAEIRWRAAGAGLLAARAAGCRFPPCGISGVAQQEEDAVMQPPARPELHTYHCCC